MFLATAPTGVLTVGTAGLSTKAQNQKGVAHLWKNAGVASLRELLLLMVVSCHFLPVALP